MGGPPPVFPPSPMTNMVAAMVPLERARYAALSVAFKAALWKLAQFAFLPAVVVESPEYVTFPPVVLTDRKGFVAGYREFPYTSVIGSHVPMSVAVPVAPPLNVQPLALVTWCR